MPPRTFLDVPQQLFGFEFKEDVYPFPHWPKCKPTPIFRADTSTGRSGFTKTAAQVFEYKEEEQLQYIERSPQLAERLIAYADPTMSQQPGLLHTLMVAEGHRPEPSSHDLFLNIVAIHAHNIAPDESDEPKLAGSERAVMQRISDEIHKPLKLMIKVRFLNLHLTP